MVRKSGADRGGGVKAPLCRGRATANPWGAPTGRPKKGIFSHAGGLFWGALGAPVWRGIWRGTPWGGGGQKSAPMPRRRVTLSATPGYAASGPTPGMGGGT